MGAVTSLLGMGGGAGGTGFQGPQQANILAPATVDQANAQYQTAQEALQKQLQFLQAVQGQNGLGNQSSVYNQLAGVAAGQGPNPAQAMLANATGANTANQAALMAGQRGASANTGLIARQAAQQGAANQQAGAGQAAAMQAQQSLGALGQMGQMANQQAAQQAAATNAYNQAVQGEQGQVLNAIGAQNNANVGMQSNVNTDNAGMAQSRLGGQANLIGNMFGAAGAALGKAEGGMIEKPQMMAQGGSLGVDANALSQFNFTPAPMATPVVAPTNGPRSNVAKYLKGQYGQQPKLEGASLAGNVIGTGMGNGLKAGWDYLFGAPAPTEVPVETQNQQMFDVGRPDMMEGNSNSAEPMDPNVMKAAEGGKVPALLSPGEKYLSPSDVKKVEKSGKNPMEVGKKVPGKPVVKGAVNSYANDTIPASLEEGGIVLPRSVTEAKHPHWEAHRFVSALMAQKGKTLPKKSK